MFTFRYSDDFLQVLARRVDDDREGRDKMEQEDQLGRNLRGAIRETHDDVVIDAVAQREVTHWSDGRVDQE